MLALKEKLEKKIENYSNDTSNSNTFSASEGNIIQFKPSETTMANSVLPEFETTMNEAKERVIMLEKFVKEMMIPNVDYGIIPRCNKPSLLKPGAEKLCDIFGFSKQIEILNRIEDWDKGLFHYEIKAILVNKRTGLIEAEGIGCCNSMETKYKKQDSYNIINTLLKMAKKRALIDAVLSATRSSGLFTQDIEDMEVTQYDPTIVEKPKVKPQVQSAKKATKKQLEEIYSIIKSNKISVDFAKKIMIEKYKINESNQLTSIQADEFIDILKCS